MTAKWEKLEGNVGVLTVEVSAEQVDKSLDAAFKKVSKKVNIPGFRKGKIPRAMFEQRFGVESLYEDAINILLQETYGKAIDEAGIDPVDQPEIDVQQIERGKEFIYTAKVVVKPEVKLGAYKGLEAAEMDATVTEEHVNEELNRMAEKHAELIVKENGTVDNGETAVIDFEGFLNGEAFEGGKGENYSLVIGSNTFIPGFEGQLIGMATGEERDIEVTFPEEYHAENLAGQPVTFKVKLHEIKAKQLPEINDEFAKDADETVENLEQLKEKVMQQLVESKEREAHAVLRDELVEKAVENAEVDIPEAMIKTETDRMIKEFEQRLGQQGMNLELYFQFTGQSEETLREQMKADAEKRVKINLVLEAIVATESIEATDEDVNAELEAMAAMYNMPVEQLKALIPNVEGLKGDLKFKKAVEFLVENKK